MFNWVVKVVPQPPDAPGTLGEPQPIVQAQPKVPPAAKASPVKPKEEEPNSDSTPNNTRTAVLTWLSNGLASTLPQPAGSPLPGRAAVDTKPISEEERNGGTVMGWIAQGLGNVLPQPEGLIRQGSEEGDDVIVTEAATEVYLVHELPDAEPLPHIPVVEVISEEEDVEDSDAEPPPGNVFQELIKQVLPQPVRTKSPPEGENCTSPDKVTSPSPSASGSLSGIEGTITSNVVGWIVNGLGIKMPSRDDTVGADALQRGKR